MAAVSEHDFTWRDAGRTVVFRPGAVGQASEVLAEHGFPSYLLLSTPRALSDAGALATNAEATLHVPSGPVPDIAAGLLEEATASHLVALGGGRVIDAAKAIAAVTGAEVAAIPTTMSGAEMTGIHRLPAGAEDRASGLVRPTLVIADPEQMTSQDEASLRASSMNALAHGADSLYTPFSSPVSETLALKGANLIATALDEPSESRDRGVLALGSILCGYAIDSALFALHHVICQTLVRVCEIPHAGTNAAILPRVMGAMRERASKEIASLADAVGADRGDIQARLLALGGDPPGLSEIGASPDCIDPSLDAILARSELAFTPDPPDREELRRIIDAAW